MGVEGFNYALKGMRNPMNSRARSDSEWYSHGSFELGRRDLQLCKNLVKSGPEHAKFLRQIQVWADIDMPRYWWSEADTYKFGTSNSASTMHKLLNTREKITVDLFERCPEDDDVLEVLVKRLEQLRVEYLLARDADDREYENYILLRAKRLLPEGFLQLRTRNTNYAELMNMYHQRKDHRLKEEWVDTFCKWCETLPYFTEICIEPVEGK